ncbi:fibronectin type III domain-containing protein, partial [Elusimicrobiota bacterium]
MDHSKPNIFRNMRSTAPSPVRAAALAAALALAAAFLPCPGWAQPITYTTMTVVDGYAASQAATLSVAGWDTDLNTDNNSKTPSVPAGTDFVDSEFMGIYFTGITIPADEVVVSGVLEFETNLGGGSNKSATLYLDVSDQNATSLWSDATETNETLQGYNTSTHTMVGTSAAFVFRTMDVTGVLDTETKIDNCEVVFRNKSNSQGSVAIDFIRLVVGTQDNVPPASVANLFASSTTASNEIYLQWDSPGDNAATLDLVAGSSFVVQYATSEDPDWSTATAQVEIPTNTVTAGGIQSYYISPLSPNTTYYFRVWTLDEEANLGDYSNMATGVTISDPPSSTQVYEMHETSATLNWEEMTALETGGYVLQASTATDFTGENDKSSSTYEAALSTLTITGLAVNTTYYFRVASLNWRSVPGYASSVSSGTLAYDPTTTAPTFTTVDTSSITVNWSANGNPAGTRYLAEISLDSAFSPVLISSMTQEDSTHFGTDGEGAALDPNATHYFRVRALSHSGFYTNYDSLGSTSTLALVPGDAVPAFSSVEITSITVEWVNGGNPAGTFYIAEISVDSGFSPVLYSSTTRNESVLWGTNGAGSALTRNTTFYFRVNALNHDNIATVFDTKGSTATLTEVASAAGFTGVGLSSITVHWTAPPDGSEGYLLQASDTEDFSGAIESSSTLDGGVTGLAVDDPPTLAGNTTYYFRLASRNHNWVHRFITVGSTSTLADQPVDASTTSVFQTSVTVSWTAPPSGAAGFEVQASTASNFGGQLVSSFTREGNSLELTVEGLSSETTYYFRVASLNWNELRHFEDAGSTFTLTSQDYFAPQKLTTLYTSTHSAEAIRLNWTGPTDASGQPLDGNYAIHYSSYLSGFSWSSAAAQVAFSTSDVMRGDFQEYIVGCLFPNTTYYFKLWASDLKPNWSGESDDFASTATLSKQVGSPWNYAPFADGFTLNWVPLPESPPDASSESARGYRITASSTDYNGKGTVYSSTTFIVSLGTLTFSGMETNTTYYLRAGSLNRHNAANFASLGSSSTLTTTITPLDPVFLDVWAGSVTANWVALPDSPDQDSSRGYLLQASSKDFDGSAVSPSSTTSSVFASTLTVFNLEPNTTYYLRAGGLNWNGSANFVALGATSTLANVPADPWFQEVFTASVTITWDLPAGGAQGYRLEACTVEDFSGAISEIETTDGGATSLTVEAPALDENTTYYFRIGTLNHNHAVHYAAVMSTDTLAKAPIRLSSDFFGVYYTSVSVQWAARPDAPQTERSEGYQLEASTAADFSGVVKSSTTNSVYVSTLVVTGLDPGTTYFFRSGSLNWIKQPNYTYLASSSTLANDPGTTTPTYDEVDISSMTIQWLANSNGPGTRYRVDVDIDPGFSGPTSSITFGLDGLLESLTPNSTYYAQVKAINPNNVSSGYTDLGSTITKANFPTAADPPWDPVNSSSMTVKWSAGSPANPGWTGYEVDISSKSDFETETILSSTTFNLWAEFTSLQVDTTYFARVRAKNGYGFLTEYLSVDNTSTLSVPPGPANPSTFTALGTEGFTLNWTTGTVADGFNPMGTSSGTVYWAEASVDAGFATISAERHTRELYAQFSGLLAGEIGRVHLEG